MSHTIIYHKYKENMIKEYIDRKNCYAIKSKLYKLL